MQTSVALVVLLSLSLSSALHAQGSPASAAPAGLYVLSIKDQLAPNGKRVNLVFREVRREAESSVVEVEVADDAGGFASVYMLLGMCGLMNDRNQKGAVAEQLSEKPMRFGVTFPTHPTIDNRSGPPRLVFNETDCQTVKRRLP